MVTIVDAGSWQLSEADENLHQAGAQLLWNESYYFDFATADGSLAGYLRLGLYPNWKRAWYWACLVRSGQPVLLLADDMLPVPEQGVSTVRGAGVAAEHEVRSPLESVVVRLDGQAAVLANPAATAAEPGTRPACRLALELEWVTAGGIYPYHGMPRYEIPCEVSGTVTAGTERFAVSGTGERDHSWGERDWWHLSWLWTAGRLADGTAFHGMQANVGIDAAWPAFIVPPGGAITGRPGFTAATSFAADGHPASARLLVPGLTLTAVPLAFGPVLMTAPDGRTSRLARALCRFSAPDGRHGFGWTEWNQPPGWREHPWAPGPAAGEPA